MSGHRFWNQTRPKYAGKEEGYNKEHEYAKERIAELLRCSGAKVYKEDPLPEYYVELLGMRTYTTDVYAFWGPPTKPTRQIVVELDGGYHFSSNYQKSKRKPKDETTAKHYHLSEEHDIFHFGVEDVYDTVNGYSDQQLREKMRLF